MHASGKVTFLIALHFLSFFYSNAENYNFRNHQNDYYVDEFLTESLLLRNTTIRSLTLQKQFQLRTTNCKTTWRINMKIKRSKSPTLQYSNSTSTFHQMLKLMHDVELNPGPQSSTQESKNNKFKTKVSIAHLNVRSMKSRESFQLVAHTILESKYIFTISESWLDPSINDADISLPGYLLFRQDRGVHKSGGGIVVYIKDTFKVSTMEHMSAVSETNFQQLWLKIQHKKFKSFILCTVYKPPDTPTSFLEDLIKTFTDSLFCG